MSATRANAIRKALRLGTPLAYASGRLAVLVLKVTRVGFANSRDLSFIDHDRFVMPRGDTGWHDIIEAKIISVPCESRQAAKVAARRAIADQSLFTNRSPQEALEVSALYADATYRNALRRRRVA